MTRQILTIEADAYDGPSLIIAYSHYVARRWSLYQQMAAIQYKEEVNNNEKI